jgi:transposase
MSNSSDDSKRNELARRGSLHPHPDKVTDALFHTDPFFDPRDAVQVKYEMIRSVRVESRSASQAAAQCGFSRPTFYEANAAFDRAGMPGLLPAKKGPRRAHKLSETVMSFVQKEIEGEPSLAMTTLAERVCERFDLRVHPRSIKRALDRRAKKNL